MDPRLGGKASREPWGSRPSVSSRPRGAPATAAGAEWEELADELYRPDREPTDPSGHRWQGRPWRWWPVAAVLLPVGLAVSLILPAGRHQWALSLIRQPAHYTALSFNSASALPSKLRAGQLVSFSFRIVNREGRRTKYDYVISESSARSSRVVAQSARTLADGMASTVSAKFHVRCRSSPCRIGISLVGQPEKIYFLVYLSSPNGHKVPVRKSHSKAIG